MADDQTTEASLTDGERDVLIEWCHRWKCSFGTDHYCGCSFDHLDREMAGLLIEAVLAPMSAERLAPLAALLATERERRVIRGRRRRALEAEKKEKVA